jgi:hypothetical protein
MKTIAHAALASFAALALAACGSSDSADEQAAAENVEMPAEEAMAGVDAEATVAADPMATATATSGVGADAAATDAAAAAAAAANAAAADAVNAGAEAATADAEKKM